jgi:sugar phosphate isomerase/epimerase
MRRREFIAASVMPLFVTTLNAREPITRTAEASFRPSLAAYSLRDYFAFMRGKPQTPRTDGKAIDFFGFIDYCASIQCEAAEITSYFLPPQVTDHYLRELRQHAFLQGITLSGTAIGNDFTVDDPSTLQSQIDDTIDWIKKTSVLGASHIRIFAGTSKQLGESEEKMSAICNAVNRCAKVAEEHGVFLGIENHGGIGADQLLQVMSRVDSSWVGINLDTGNFVSEDPYREMELCAPYAVNVQFKPSLRTPQGKAYPADFDRIAAILRASRYRGFVALEYEEEQPYERIPELFQKMKTALVSLE